MAVKYVKSTTGSDSNGGTSWADAYATVAKALGVNAAGDTVYVSQAHAETKASSITWTSAGTAANPVRILCVNDGATPPTAISTGATVTTTGGGSAIAFGTGYAYVYGIALVAGDSAGVAINFASASSGWTLESCSLTLNATAASSPRIVVGTSSGSGAQWVKWINTQVQFTNTGQAIQPGQAKWLWVNTASAILQVIAGNALPATLIIPAAGPAGGYVDIAGVDLSALGSGKTLVSASVALPAKIGFRNCKTGSSVSTITGTIGSPGGMEVWFDNSDSSNTNYRMERYFFQGSIKSETTHVRSSGGATDGTTPLSHNFAGLSSGPTLFSPFEGPWIEEWNETTGSSITVTVELCTENSVLTNADCYLEVEYLGTSSFPESIFLTSRVADVFASSANLTTSAVTWSGFTTPKPQSIALSFTPQVKGLIRARVCLVKSNATIYVDPQISVGSGPSISRSMMIPGGTYHNETATGGGTTGLPRSRVFTGY